ERTEMHHNRGSQAPGASALAPRTSPCAHHPFFQGAREGGRTRIFPRRLSRRYFSVLPDSIPDARTVFGCDRSNVAIASCRRLKVRSELRIPCPHRRLPSVFLTDRIRTM